MKAAPLVSHFPSARGLAASPANASVNSLTPANGIVGASAVDNATDGKLVDGAHSRPDSKPVALLRDAQHRLLDRFVGHPLGQEASFFGSLLPIFGVIDIRCNGHGTRPFADRERPQGSFHDDGPPGPPSPRPKGQRAGEERNNAGRRFKFPIDSPS